jgi:hypothetical protein
MRALHSRPELPHWWNHRQDPPVHHWPATVGGIRAMMWHLGHRVSKGDAAAAAIRAVCADLTREGFALHIAAGGETGQRFETWWLT